MDNVDLAASLAAWLIDKQQVKRNTAVIIGCNKHKVPFSLRPAVSKKATEIMKLKQPSLL